ncbi:MAG: DNA-processing protein DprA [Marinobacter sp.]|jgi:DNA processing protein
MSIQTISSETMLVLQAMNLPGVGPAALRKLLGALSISKPHSNSNDVKIFLEKKLVGSDVITPEFKANEIVMKCEDNDIQIISPFDSSYPEPLTLIDDYPPILYVKGRLNSLSKKSCAVVGTREASKLGLSWAKQIASLMAENNFSIVSGLALGIDAAAHKGALESNGTTVAILAHGLDRVTPSSNRRLADEILANDGALVSEHAPGVPPRRAEYVRRNRIQSGMSLCSIIVESGGTGGAMHQGNFTKKQKRLLFCAYPASDVRGADDFNFEGAKKLMSDSGAIAIKSSDELISIIQSKEIDNNYGVISKISRSLV